MPDADAEAGIDLVAGVTRSGRTDRVSAMDKKELKELMEYIAKSNFVEFEMERSGFKLKLVKEGARPASGNHGVPLAAVAPVAAIAHAAPAAAPAAPATASAAAIPAAAAQAAEQAGDIFQVISPMVGTFYRSPNPTAPAYVQVGDTVKKGQVICIIEAMKLMNEIESEVAGEVIDVPVSNGQPVEYGEVLFRIRVTPS